VAALPRSGVEGLHREVEQLRRFAAEPDASGRVVGQDVEHLFSRFLQAKVPGRGEVFLTLVEGRPFLATAAPYRLSEDPVLLARWSSPAPRARRGG
jgi:hypothetical protein